MRNNKQLLFASMGFLGGVTGALAGELTPQFAHSPVILVFQVAIWFAVCASFITVCLVSAAEIYNRRKFVFRVFRRAIIAGAIAGAVAGGIAQAVYSVHSEPGYFKFLVLRSACWGLLGATLGWRLSAVVPNLGTTRGLAAGALGGVIGGIGFLIISSILPETLGRMTGLGILGAALGLAVVWVEALFREASLEITWAPREITSVTLGARPVYVGGGDDHIYIAGLPQHAAGVVHENGKIQYIEAGTGKRTDLRDGSKLKIGGVELLVRAKV